MMRPMSAFCLFLFLFDFLQKKLISIQKMTSTFWVEKVLIIYQWVHTYVPRYVLLS